MDPSRKRQIRLFIALGFAVVLATALVYTSFNASSEARQPSQLLNATPGQSYELTGTVVRGSVKDYGDTIKFRVADRDGASTQLPVKYSGIVPDPFRGGREIVLQGTVAKNGVFEGDRDTLVTKCPSKFSEKKN